MADYWVSTPKYWCKYCKLFVRDTPLEKRNHEASPRHQGGLQRFLKDLHKTNEREAREAQRAKDEVARLNGLPRSSTSSAGPSGSKTTTQTRKSGTTGGSGPPRQATAAERKEQMAQLAAMGVVVPEEFRKDNGMMGEWQTTAVQAPNPLPPNRPSRVKEENADAEEVSGLHDAASERKRKLPHDGEEEDGAQVAKGRRKPNWGSDVKTIGSTDIDDDLDALLAGTTTKIGLKLKNELDGEVPGASEEETARSPSAGVKQQTTIKVEASDEVMLLVDTKGSVAEAVTDDIAESKPDEGEDVGFMFKKRKKKALRQN